MTNAEVEPLCDVEQYALMKSDLCAKSLCEFGGIAFWQFGLCERSSLVLTGVHSVKTAS